jgi:hypothetical protein
MEEHMADSALQSQTTNRSVLQFVFVISSLGNSNNNNQQQNNNNNKNKVDGELIVFGSRERRGY